MRVVLSVSVMSLAAVVGFACSSSDADSAGSGPSGSDPCPQFCPDPDGGSNGNDASGAGATIHPRVKLARAAQGANGHFLSINGSAVGAGLSSLKYLIREVRICKTLDVHGSAYDNPSGCISLYHGPSNPGLEAASSPDNASVKYVRENNVTEGYVDMMDDASRGTLTGSVHVAPNDVGDYAWGLVTWSDAVKVTATITNPNGGGELLYTHDGTNDTAVSLNGSDFYPTVSATSFTSGPASEAIGSIHNGGTWFRFQRPFSISAEDIVTSAEFDLDLAFDPDGMIQGVTAPGATNFPTLVDTTTPPPSPGWNSISLPILELTPIAHKATSLVVRETYVAHVVTASSGQDLRLELYGLNDDPSNSIYGVNNAYIPNGSTTGYIAGAPQVVRVVSASEADGGTDGGASDADAGVDAGLDELLSFEDTQGVAVVRGFRRQPIVGETTTAQVPCGGGLIADDAVCTDGYLTVTYTLEARETL